MAHTNAARLAQCHELAAARGGVCLSRRYDGSTTRVRWRCAEGHTFATLIYPVIHGAWCPECARHYRLPEQARKQRLVDLGALAVQRGGTCRSPAYINEKSPLEWSCAAGHTWQATAAAVRRGRWCPRCAGRGATIADMQELARKAGGTCLSTVYVNASTQLRWRCGRGHIWEARPSNIRRHTWCPTCAGLRSGGLAELQQIARKHGGACLAEHYRNGDTKVPWRCVAGHTWSAPPGRIRRGSWCPQCAGHQRGDMARMHKLARQKRGRCLSTEYVNSENKLTWRCAEGHEWDATPAAIARGTWCPECHRTSGRPRPRVTLADVQAAAAARGGRCRSRVYVTSATKLEFECAFGHRWDARPTLVLRRGTWCPHCAGTVKGTLAAMRRLAKESGGRCLSTAYVDNRTHLEWECAEGHRWFAMPFQVQKGAWCAKCAGTARLDIETMQRLAEERGGRCISKRYVNLVTPLKWECAAGHRWTSRPTNIRAGAWCVRCSGRVPYDLPRMREIAASRGGKCLSSTYEGPKVPMRWRCQQKHVWTSTAKTVVSGAWCPECARAKARGPRAPLAATVRGSAVPRPPAPR